jgi:nucleotide-binding universal stress UspA family protein
MSATIAVHHDPDGTLAPFKRVVVGVDGGEEALEAVRQAVGLVAPTGGLELLYAVDRGESAIAGSRAFPLTAQIERDADEVVSRARAVAGRGATSRIVSGVPVPAILDELAATRATLVAVGASEHGRSSEIPGRGVAAGLLRRAPCSVLVARKPALPAFFPRTVVAGLDGSPQSDAAIAVAHAVAERFDASLDVVTALDGAGALVAACRGADLLVVGCRGLRGLAALGSVSEQVAHLADCSVLVVRGVG